jgi:hypothetical protein
MSYRLKWFFVRNWQASLAVLAVWFVYAAMRDGSSIHNHFLGLSVGERGGHNYPPWIVIFAIEAILLAWYFLPSKAYCRHIRLLAAVSGVLLLMALAFSSSGGLGLEHSVAIYVFASILVYAICWPSELAI